MNKTELSLSEAKPNKKYRITEISVSSAMRERLRELGIIRGTEITQVVSGRGGEIALYAVRGSRIALRRESATSITVVEWEG